MWKKMCSRSERNHAIGSRRAQIPGAVLICLGVVALFAPSSSFASNRAALGLAPGLCKSDKLDKTRGSVPAAFPIDACIGTQNIWLHNTLKIPIAISVSGSASRPIRTHDTRTIAADATRLKYEQPSVLLPGETARVQIGQGAASVAIDDSSAEKFYLIADKIAGNIDAPGAAGDGLSVATIVIDLAAEFEEDLVQYGNCATGANERTKVLCRANFGLIVASQVAHEETGGLDLYTQLLALYQDVAWVNALRGNTLTPRKYPLKITVAAVRSGGPTNPPSGAMPTPTPTPLPLPEVGLRVQISMNSDAGIRSGSCNPNLGGGFYYGETSSDITVNTLSPSQGGWVTTSGFSYLTMLTDPADVAAPHGTDAEVNVLSPDGTTIELVLDQGLSYVGQSNLCLHPVGDIPVGATVPFDITPEDWSTVSVGSTVDHGCLSDVILSHTDVSRWQFTATLGTLRNPNGAPDCRAE